MDLNFSKFFDSPSLLFKIVALVFLFLYVVFTFVILTQVNVMNKIITEERSSALLKTIAIIHVVLAISLFVFAIVIL